MKSYKNLVWFKKDLRVTDHLPLLKACSTGRTLCLFVIEEEWLNSYECSDIHKQFLRECLIDLKNQLKEIGLELQVIPGETLQVLSDLHKKHSFKNLWSHQETGVFWTYQRDLRVKRWCQDHSVNWSEHSQFAVVRKLKNRDLWQKERVRIIERELYPKAQVSPPLYSPQGLKFDLSPLETSQYNKELQQGGSSQGIKTLQIFYEKRGLNYSKEMSSPNTAYSSCSRISPYLSWGCLSLSQVHHSIRKKEQKLSLKNFKEQKQWERSLRSFESRLWWHCHFIQKLESEPEIEFHNMNPAFNGMRENSFKPEYFEAWKNGETGYPIIDAAMKYLEKTGWINLRMRALLVSFAAYHLWIHWDKIGHHLAKLFIDFEAGIHYSQLQMQSGVTGINSIRIYSPIKQTLDQDPQGSFIKAHLPQLKGLSAKDLSAPWDSPPMILSMMGIELGKDYPRPIVDHKGAYQKAKETIFKWRDSEKVKKESRKVYDKHGSRKHKNFPKQTRKAF